MTRSRLEILIRGFAFAAGEDAGVSGLTLLASLSSRNPRKLPCLTLPSPVNSAKAISATSFGVIQFASRLSAFGTAADGVLRANGFILVASSSMTSSVKPVPTRPL